MTARGEPFGTLNFVPQQCRSGEHESFYGVLLLGEDETSGAIKAEDDTVWYEFREGDELPFEFGLFGDAAAVGEPTTLVARRNFWLILSRDRQIRISYDGKTSAMDEMEFLLTVVPGPDGKGSHRVDQPPRNRRRRRSVARDHGAAEVGPGVDASSSADRGEGPVEDVGEGARRVARSASCDATLRQPVVAAVASEAKPPGWRIVVGPGIRKITRVRCPIGHTMDRRIERKMVASAMLAGLIACGPSVAIPEDANAGDGTGTAGSDTGAEATGSQTGGAGLTQTGVDPDSATGGFDSSDGDGSTSTGVDEAGWLPEARDEFQTYAELYEKVIRRTCTPFNNVCHHNSETPDMTEADSLFNSIGSPCRATGILCITPGSPQASALFQRVAGEPSGSSMPLAGGRLNDAEIGAIACWIETLQDGVEAQVGDIIDYENCSYAAQGG